ncbi:hypothetical protein MMC29_000151 [Sticta canariensis]|nr:hypothetical protein [Sticta canariensis]
MSGVVYSSRERGRRVIDDTWINPGNPHERANLHERVNLHEAVREPRDRALNRHHHDVEVHRETQTRIEIGLETIRHEVSLYSHPVQKRLDPLIKNKRVMKVAADTFSRFDFDPELLAKISAELLKHAGSVMQETDYETESEIELERAYENERDEEIAEQEMEYIIESGAGGGSVYEDEWDYASAELGRGNLVGHRQEGGRLNPGPDPTRFIHWSGFKAYALRGKADMVDDKKKVVASLWHAVKVGVTTSFGGFEIEGLFGALLGTLRRQDYRAYLNTMDREILLPDVTSKNPDQRDLETYEKNLLGTTRLLGFCRDLTCVTYSDSDYGTITHFRVETTRKNGEEWPTSIHPVAVMERIPKKVLKITADGVPRSQKTTLRVSTAKFKPLEWSLLRRLTGNAKPLEWSLPSKQSRPYIDHSDNIQRSHMSTDMQETLGIDMKKVNSKPSINYVMATIPQMLAWLHVKASYLTEIEMDGIDFQPRAIGNTKRQSFRRVVRWRNAPVLMEHEGKNPHIVLLHPESGAWVTKPIYWT